MANIISASRRTDIPGNPKYLRWFHTRLRLGNVTVANPRFPSKTSVVSLLPEDIHTIVFWSKNYQHLLEYPEMFQDYHKFFHFTITGLPRWIEPGLPVSLNETIEQFRQLVKIYGAERVMWRFDPILHWYNGPSILSNAFNFPDLCEKMADAGCIKCTFSFCSWYGKCEARAKRLEFKYLDPPIATKKLMVGQMTKVAAVQGIKLYTCCGPEFLRFKNVYQARCIDGELLERLSLKKTSLAKDTGQRKTCGCTKSRDIGNYSEQRCEHGCIYCYANPKV